MSPDLLPVYAYLARLRRADAEDALGHLAPAGPDESGQPHDLTPAHYEVYVFELTGTAQAAYLEGHLASAVWTPGEQLVQGSSHHEADQLLGVELVGRRGGDVVPVPQYGDTVGEREDLVEAVRDVDHAHATGGQVRDDPEELLDLPLGQGGCRLVHDHGLGLPHQGPGDGHDLLVGRREPLDAGGDAPIGAEGAQPPLRLGPHGVPVQPAPAGARSVATDEQVLGNREFGEEVELLRDHGDPGFLRIPRRGELDHLATDLQRSLIWCIETVDYLHERALAGAVLADQGVHLTRAQVEIYALYGRHAAEAFGDAPEPEDSRCFSDRSTSLCAAVVG